MCPCIPRECNLVHRSSLLRLSAHHLALAASALQPLQSGTLSLHLSVPVPVLIPSRRHVKTHYCQPQCRLLLTIVCVYKLYLLTYFCAPLLHHEPPVHTPDNTLICSSVFAGLTLVTNRQTDTRDGPRYVCSNRPHVTPCVATRLRKEKIKDARIRL